MSSDQDIKKVLKRYNLKMEIDTKDSLEMILFGVWVDFLVKMVLYYRQEYGKKECLYQKFNEKD